jgi:hypothetical protein
MITSQFAAVPTATIGPVPVVVKTPMLKERARRNGSSMPSAAAPLSAPSPRPRYASAKIPFVSRRAPNSQPRNVGQRALSARR